MLVVGLRKLFICNGITGMLTITLRSVHTSRKLQQYLHYHPSDWWCVVCLSFFLRSAPVWWALSLCCGICTGFQFQNKLNTTILLLCAGGGGGHLSFLWISTSQLCRLFNFQLFECSSKMSSEEKLCFLVCWEDKNAGLLKNFHLYFYPSEKSVEMFDLRIKKVFLKKTETSQIKQGVYPLIQTR